MFLEKWMVLFHNKFSFSHLLINLELYVINQVFPTYRFTSRKTDFSLITVLSKSSALVQNWKTAVFRKFLLISKRNW